MKTAVLSLILFVQAPCNHPDGHCPEPLSKQELSDIKALGKAQAREKYRVCRVPVLNRLFPKCR